MHPSQASSSNRDRRCTVLVVDGNEPTRARVSRALDCAGYAAIVAADGPAALKTITTSPQIDAIVLDLVMPWSWEFRRFQLADRRLGPIPTIVTTPRALSAHERYTLRIGHALVVHKPFGDTELLASLGRILAPGVSAGADDHRWRSRDGHFLMWSKHGRVACETHAPAADSEECRAEGWTWIPRFAGKNKIEYTCEECWGGPIAHAKGVAAAEPTVRRVQSPTGPLVEPSSMMRHNGTP